MTASAQPRNRLWIEAVAARLGFEWVSRRLTGTDRWSPYLLVITVYILDIPVLTILGHLADASYSFNPIGAVGLPTGLLFAVWASRRLRTRYGTAVEDLTSADALPDRYRRSLSRPAFALLSLGSAVDPDGDSHRMVRELISNRLKAGLYLGALALYLAHLYLNPTSPEIVYNLEGPIVATFKVWFIVPVIYMLVAVDFVGTYVGVVGLLPLKIRHIGLIDFRDPLGYGQLKPAGDLIRTATVYFFIALTAYTVWITSGDFLGTRTAVDVQTIITGAIVGGTVLGIVLFFLPIISLHGYMKHAKHEKIMEIASQIRSGGPTDDEEIFPETSVPRDADEGIEYTQLFIDLTVVGNMREYPIDVSHLQEIILAAIIPYVAHVTTTVVLEILPSGH